MSNMVKSQNPEPIIKASLDFMTRLNVISNKELRKSLQSEFVKILDMALANFSQYIEIIQRADDLMADLSLESTKTAFDIECQVREIESDSK